MSERQLGLRGCWGTAHGAVPQHSCCSEFTLNNGAVGDGGIFQDNHNPVTDIETLRLPLCFFHPVFVDNLDITANAGILINDARRIMLLAPMPIGIFP